MPSAAATEAAFGPLTRTTAIAPRPGGVEMAAIVSTGSEALSLFNKQGTSCYALGFFFPGFFLVPGFFAFPDLAPGSAFGLPASAAPSSGEAAALSG